MNKNNYLLLRNLCILIIIILIIRYLYKRIYTNKNNFEGFEINNNDAIDLLTKNKRQKVKNTYFQIYDSDRQIDQSQIDSKQIDRWIVYNLFVNANVPPH